MTTMLEWLKNTVLISKMPLPNQVREKKVENLIRKSEEALGGKYNLKKMSKHVLTL